MISKLKHAVAICIVPLLLSVSPMGFAALHLQLELGGHQYNAVLNKNSALEKQLRESSFSDAEINHHYTGYLADVPGSWLRMSISMAAGRVSSRYLNNCTLLMATMYHCVATASLKTPLPRAQSMPLVTSRHRAVFPVTIMVRRATYFHHLKKTAHLPCHNHVKCSNGVLANCVIKRSVMAAAANCV